MSLPGGNGRRYAAAFFWLKRARRPAHPERRRRVEAALYCNPPVSPRASELQQGTSSAPTPYLWVRGPSGPLPPEAARSRAGRRPAPWWQWSPLRGGVFLAEAGQKARAPRAPPSSRSSSVLQPARIAAGIGTAAGHFIRPDAVSLGARAFWPAAAEGGQVTCRPEAGSLGGNGRRYAAAFFWLKRARRPAHPERRRRVEAALYCNPPVSPRASELQQGTSSAPTLYLWVRGPSGLLPPEAARSRAGRRPAPWWQWSPLRGGVFLAEAGQKARAPRAPPSSRGSSVLQPARIAAGVGTAAGHFIRPDAVSLGARAFWPAAAGGGQVTRRPEAGSLVAMVAATRRRFSG